MARRATRGFWLAAVIAVPLAASPAAKPMPDYAVRAAAANRAACVPAVAELKKAGVIRRQPAPNRFDIDEAYWKTPRPLDRDLIFSMMACTVFGGRTQTYLNDAEFVVLHGFPSGKRLMRGSKAGVVAD